MQAIKPPKQSIQVTRLLRMLRILAMTGRGRLFPTPYFLLLSTIHYPLLRPYSIERNLPILLYMEIINYVGFDKKEKAAPHTTTASRSAINSRLNTIPRTALTSCTAFTARPAQTLRSASASHPSAIRSGWSASSINGMSTAQSLRTTHRQLTDSAHRTSFGRANGQALNTLSSVILSAKTRTQEDKSPQVKSASSPALSAAPSAASSFLASPMPSPLAFQTQIEKEHLQTLSTARGKTTGIAESYNGETVYRGGESTTSFAAAPIASAASAVRARRSFLAYVGMFASIVQKAVPSTLAFITAAAAGGVLVLGADWYASHTGPLALQDGSTAELDALSSIMSSFASGKGAKNNSEGEGIADGTVDELSALAAAAGPVIKSTVTWQTYTVRKGDTIIGISRRFGLENISTIIAVNGVDNARAIQAGKKIRIPSMDGLVYTVKAGNSLAGISAKYSVSVEDLLDVNDLSTNELTAGQELFIPGATMDGSALREAMGDLFKCPLKAAYRISSHFGWRADPFTGVRSFHSGVDMAAPQGTPIYAAMGGKVITAGWSNVFGNYVIVDHRNGYQSLYGHMSKRIAIRGQIVNQGDRLGLVGSTGYSTGPHLHFTVYKRGALTDPMVLLRR